MKQQLLLAGAALALSFALPLARAQENPKEQDPSQDPFGDMAPTPPPRTPPVDGEKSWIRNFLDDNFGFRKEIMSEFDSSQDGNLASRQSIGFEVLKKFSTDTSTIASLDFQGRLVRRDGFNPVQNDMDGMNRQSWSFEIHNLYWDFYNVFNPLLNDEQRSNSVGRFNVRAGHFYVPFGLNLQTDTHGTVLQLSNREDFGFELDWYAGFWGRLTRNLNYDAYYMLGSGDDLKVEGQRGMAALRISLSNRYSAAYGLEGGVSIVAGQRLVEQNGPPNAVIATKRAGVDLRYRHAIPTGLFTLSTELSGGTDAGRAVTMQLGQAEYLHSSRRWGLAAQYRHYEQEGQPARTSAVGEFTWYFRNDVGNSNLHWIKLNVERRFSASANAGPARPGTTITIQYYFYQ